MAFEDITFPVYRKYKNNKHFFKVLSPREFEEVQLIGGKKLKHTIVATQFPEMTLIHDLVYNYHGFGDAISAEEYQSYSQ